MNITVDRAVIERALDALDEIIKWYGVRDKAEVLMAPHNQNPEIKQAMELVPALRTALEQPEQEPVAMRYDFDGYGYKYIDSGSGSNWQTRIKDAEPLYEGPSQRKPLSDDGIQAIWKKTFESGSSPNTFARAIEHAHNIKE